MAEPEAEPDGRYFRFTVSDRLEHWAQILTFIPLAVTGLVQRYSEAALSRFLIDLMGGIEATRTLHRVFAGALMVAAVYHVGAIGYRRFVLGIPRAMGVNRGDLRAVRQMIAYQFGRAERPEQGRYTFEEKVEYWSLVWGTVLMIVTGFMLWNPIATARILPGEFIPAAKSVHGFEAVLAVLAILVWHLYHVHVRHFNRSMFTGYLSMDDMARDHALELASTPSGGPEPPDPDELRSRRRTYLPTFGVAGLVLLGGIYLFVTFEDTAITTIEPIEQPTVFAPVTTTTTTTIAPTTTTSATTTTGAVAAGSGWADVAVLLDAKCGACHGASLQTAGLDLSTYQGALAGGDSGPGIVPGDPDASQVVITMVAGDHPGQLTDAEISLLVAWIEDGAPEVAGADAGAATTTTTTTTPTTTTTVVVEALSWDSFAEVLAAGCGACHGAANQLGGLDLSSYQAALAGGESGPGIVPGDTAASQLVIVQAEGGHPGQLGEEELALLTRWIEDGAVETAAVGAGATTTTIAGADAVWADFAGVFEEKCSACHGRVGPIADLDLSRYEGALAGGDTGPGIVPGDPDASQIVITQAAGGHPGQLSNAEIDALIRWIEAGAPNG